MCDYDHDYSQMDTFDRLWYDDPWDCIIIEDEVSILTVPDSLANLIHENSPNDLKNVPK